MVERARIDDIATLTAFRLAYLQEDCGERKEEVVSKLAEDLPAHFEKNLNQNIFCYLMRETEEVVACAFLLIVEKPARIISRIIGKRDIWVQLPRLLLSYQNTIFFTNHNSAIPNRQYECEEVSSRWKLSRARTETTMSY